MKLASFSLHHCQETKHEVQFASVTIPENFRNQN